MKPATAAAAALLILIGFAITKPTKCQTVAKPGCRDKCGEVEIHYPFGVGDEKCFLDPGFNLTCDKDSKLWTTQFKNGESSGDDDQSQIIGIDPAMGTMEILMPVSRHCFNKTGNETANEKYKVGVEPPTFTVSSRANKFFAIGSNTFGILRANIIRNDSNIPNHDYRFWMGCFSSCLYEKPGESDIKECSGIGCCNFTFPSGMREIQTLAYNFLYEEDFKPVWNYSNCTYSFVSRNGWLRDHPLSDLNNLPFNSSGLVIDWAVGNENQTCREDDDDPHTHDIINICSGVNNAECVNSTTKHGYRCKCKDGYVGNPYLGCQNKDECKEGGYNNPCHGHATCKDLPGSYTCTCKKGFEGDGKRDGNGCVLKSGGRNTLLVVLLSASLGVTTLLLFSLYIYRRSRKRMLIKLKEQFFEQNGGLLLQQQLEGGNGGRMKIYTLKDLKKATNNFDQKLILGQGGYGTVYKGVLEDSSVVAIKKSKISDQTQVEQFIHEVDVLSQINHRNVVKLFGCCLETQVPMLVYEFITNGTLSDHLHRDDGSPKMPFAARLRVASESAGAISYLHSSASLPIIHRDIKTSNILLDERLTAKVSDFGASRLIPLDHTRVTTQVQGTFGYLDPEYFYTGELTEKSDVYSFGVVLAELLTGEKAVSFSRAEEDRNLCAYFVSALNNGRLGQVLDSHIVNNGAVMFEHLLEVAEIARRCMNAKRDDRPTMKEVAMELERLRNQVDEKGDEQPWRGSGEEDEMCCDEMPGEKSVIMSSQVVDGGDSSMSMSIVSGESSGNMDTNSILMSLRGGR
ncbi:unnamed protein product [Cuscuta campestris]|uniref:Protein kinase domain-containing protein n=1 Tax=Cuscuta campestris TaxID=132261 RepID=A0A484M8E3_9ASTE|nr:unnamed protein product [Cuscuta campestris]